jgi:hypothetical protein
MDLKTHFLRAYANLPLGVRKEIIVVLDPEGPVTWEVAYLEIKNDTPVSTRILQKMAMLELI